MEEFWKAAGLLLLTTILCLAIGKTEKDFSLLLAMAACCIVSVLSFTYLEPVMDLLRELSSVGEMQNDVMGILLKAVGITLVTELAGMVCNDAGNGSLGKTLQLLGTSAILYISIPVFTSFLTMIRDILGEL